MNVNLRFIFVLATGIIIQAVVVPLVSINHVKPDLVLVIVAGFGFLDGPAQGAVGGFAGGLLMDLISFQGLGVEALIKTLIGYFSGQVERTVFGDGTIMPMLAIGGVSVVSQTLYVFLSAVLGEPVRFIEAARLIIFPSAVYTAAVGFFVFPMLTRLLSAEREATVFK